MQSLVLTTTNPTVVQRPVYPRCPRNSADVAGHHAQLHFEVVSYPCFACESRQSTEKRSSSRTSPTCSSQVLWMLPCPRLYNHLRYTILIASFEVAGLRYCYWCLYSDRKRRHYCSCRLPRLQKADLSDIEGPELVFEGHGGNESAYEFTICPETGGSTVLLQ